MSAASAQKLTVALAGNPNVGKSTLFNSLTGMKQHTGNWPGKTVEQVQGTVIWQGVEISLVDLPGTHSLSGDSEDERVAAQYIASGEADCVVAVCDGSCLARSLILTVELLKSAKRVVVCVNLMDEARRKRISIDSKKLSNTLNVPVVLTSAGDSESLRGLLAEICHTASGPEQLRCLEGDTVVLAQEIAASCTQVLSGYDPQLRRNVESLFVSRRFGVPFLGLLLVLIVWLTVWGANYPSQLLENLFSMCYDRLCLWSQGWPDWLQGILIHGMFATAGRVICVMLPPMAIFFPLFTFLEDVGYLPRMAFLLDPCMARCGGCGRQALTLCMGLGCNAVGVTGCRIIASPRQRLAAMLTNALVPCNGRFPSLVLLGSLLFPEAGAALVVAACVALGVVGAMTISGVLRRTVLRSDYSTFLMEMPPFRRPRLGQILVRSLVDRTLHIAARAITVAAPAGALLWLLAHTGSLQSVCAFLEPAGQLLGMNGVILTAFLFCLPANELLIPVMLLILTGGTQLQAVEGMGTELISGMITAKTAVCTMVFTLFHWPCATTLMTFYRQTHSIKKTAAALLLPTAVGAICCLILNLVL